MTESNKNNRAELRVLRVITFLSVLVALCACAALIILIVTEKSRNEMNLDRSNNFQLTKKEMDPKCTICEQNDNVGESAEPFVLQELTEKELRSVEKFVINQAELRLTPDLSLEKVKSSYIVYIDLFLPNKSSVLSYINKITSVKPPRQAKVMIAHGDSNPPVVQEYVVGDLPDLSWFKKHFNSAYNKPVIPFNLRQASLFEEIYSYEVLKPYIDSKIQGLLKESFGSTFTNCKVNGHCLQMIETYLDEMKNKGRFIWWFAFHDYDGIFLHPLGFGVQINETSLNHKDWFISKVFYNGKVFNSLDSLKTDYEQNKLNVSKIIYKNKEHIFSRLKRHGSDNQYTTKIHGPKLVEPQGRRYKVIGRQVEYRGWKFQVSTSLVHGLRVYDVMFRDERIAYEISFQEACAFYGGNNPYAWTSFYYDTSEMLGASLNRLAKGIDCPDTAVYLDTVFHFGKIMKQKDSLCIFEHFGDVPLRRHFDSDYEGGYNYYGGLNDHYLIIRGIGTFYNYDYVFDFIFRPNGVIQIRLSTTGFPQATYATHKELKYGGLLNSKYALANIHQHLINVKVDFDILGEENCFSTYNFETENMTLPTNGEMLQQHAYTVTKLKTEKDAAIQFEFNKPKYYVVYNSKAINPMGYYRAYRIQNDAMTKLLLNKESKAGSASWANYQVACSVYKDSEGSSSHHYNSQDPFDPVIDFDKYIEDNENIVDKDLVFWLSFGTFHLPCTEDSPLTATSGNQLSVYLKPFNFFDECPSMQSKDAVYIYSNGTADINGVLRNVSCAQKDGKFGLA